jgi:hypothetical protein
VWNGSHSLRTVLLLHRHSHHLLLSRLHRKWCILLPVVSLASCTQIYFYQVPNLWLEIPVRHVFLAILRKITMNLRSLLWFLKKNRSIFVMKEDFFCFLTHHWILTWTRRLKTSPPGTHRKLVKYRPAFPLYTDVCQSQLILAFFQSCQYQLSESSYFHVC